MQSPPDKNENRKRWTYRHLSILSRRFISDLAPFGEWRDEYGDLRMHVNTENDDQIHRIAQVYFDTLRVCDLPDALKVQLLFRASWTAMHFLDLYTVSEVHFMAQDEAKDLFALRLAYDWPERASMIILEQLDVAQHFRKA